MPSPLLLLPPSKGKRAGGDGPAYARTLPAGHPLTGPRREVLDALRSDADTLDDRAVRRVAGVASGEVDAARRTLRDLAGAATEPAHRRYTGVVHGNAGLADLDPSTVAAEVRIVSPLLGLAAPGDPVPAYRLELGASLPSLGGLGPYWRVVLDDHLQELCAGRRVWDLLPGEHRRIWTEETRTAVAPVDVRFVRPDGRAANAARTKVAKGRLVATLLEYPDLDPAGLARAARLDEGWTLAADEASLTATFDG